MITPRYVAEAASRAPRRRCLRFRYAMLRFFVAIAGYIPFSLIIAMPRVRDIYAKDIILAYASFIYAFIFADDTCHYYYFSVHYYFALYVIAAFAIIDDITMPLLRTLLRHITPLFSPL